MIKNESSNHLIDCPTCSSSFLTKLQNHKLYKYIYKQNYYIGVKIIKYSKKIKNAISAIAFSLWEVLEYVGKTYFDKWSRYFNRRKLELQQPLEDIKESIDEFKQSLEQAQTKTDTSVADTYIIQAKLFFKKNKAYFSRSISYVLPLGALIVLFSIMVYYNYNTYALEVTYNGENIGYISDESVFSEAEKQMKNRIILEDYVKPKQTIPTFKLKMVKKQDLTSVDQLTDEIIEASGNVVESAEGLYVQGQFLGATKNSGEVLELLNSMLDDYKSEDIIKAEFDKPIEIKNGLYPTSSIINVAQMKQTLISEQEQERTYIVQSGDAPSVIADKVDMKYADLKALNPDIEKKLLPGQEILIARSEKYIDVKVVKELVYEEDVAFETVQEVDKDHIKGYFKETQEGVAGKQKVVANVSYLGNQEVERKIISTDVIVEPVARKVTVGGSKPLEKVPTGNSGTAPGSFIWPVQGGYISCPMYGYPGHVGLDIAAPSGTGVLASASGTVVKVSYNTMRGKYIIIDHGGGIRTTYMHNSATYVKVGQYVEQGTLIAGVGRTGNATGNHLHIEFTVNGKLMNPEKYINTKNKERRW